MSDLGAARHAALLCVLAGLMAASSAHAAYPGQNGKIAGTHTSYKLVVIDPVTGTIDPIESSSLPGGPVWSPDGSRIAYQSREVTGTTVQPGEIHSVNPDGTGDVALAPDPADDNNPSWSPDGTKIVFDSTRDGDFGVRELYVMDADGTNVQRLTNLEELEGQAHSPAWSPDGTRIAYIGRISTLPWRLRVINVDGTGDQAITPDNFRVGAPDWSPDASKVVTEGEFDANPDRFFTVEPDGSNLAALPNTADDGDTGGGTTYSGPKFSPDGTRILFTFNQWIPNAGAPGLMSQRLDGTDRRTHANPTGKNEGYGSADWQPVPVNSYPRPKGATPLRVPLVVGFPECTTPNKVHGPPLGHPSCGDNYNPVPTSSRHLIVGTPDTNGAPANFVGFLRIGVQVGNPATPADEADLRLMVSTTDIRCRPVAAPATCGGSNIVGADYVGELQARVALRITDKDNTPTPSGPGAATTVDMPYSFTVSCTETPDNTIGSACGVDTTADALMPGAIKEGARAIWQLGQVEVLDGGPDGDVDTPAGADVFLRQGIFVP